VSVGEENGFINTLEKLNEKLDNYLNRMKNKKLTNTVK
jgi:hypothetical protein